MHARRATPCMMVFLLASLVLSGCIKDSEPTEAEDQEPVDDPMEVYWGNATALPLLAGTFTWHDTENDPLEYYDLLAQPLAHPCIYDEGRQIYFTNLHLNAAVERIDNPVLPGTSVLEVTLDWPSSAYGGDELLIGYRSPNAELYQESAYIQRGQTGTILVPPEAWEQPGHSSAWDLWVCLRRTSDAQFTQQVPPKIFLGDVDVTINLVRLLR